MVKRVQCRVVESASLGSGSFCAGPPFDYTPFDSAPFDYTQDRHGKQDREPAEVSELSGGDATCHEPVERDIAKILGLIYNIKCSWLRKQLSNRNAQPGLIVDFVA